MSSVVPTAPWGVLEWQPRFGVVLVGGFISNP